VKINTTLISLADARRLLDAVQGLGHTPPERVAAVLTARERLAEAPALSRTPRNSS
jgi:hypothetical protein